MAPAWKQLSVTKRSASIAASVSLGILVGQFAGQCLSEHGVCTVGSPTPFIYAAITFVAGWAVIAAALWGLERHRRNHPGHETR